jgi:pimeloyl-ACP methyl ester carboxylesterase
MRYAILITAAVLLLSAQPQAQSPAAACTKATAACTEWVALGSGPARSLIYRSRSLDARNPAIQRALIMIHGTNRNADDYFTTAVTAAFIAGALDDTVVISPRIASQSGSCKDELAANEVSWSCTGDSWRSGGTSTSHPDLASFDFIDQILRKLANKNIFPNMRAIVVAGHSAGGQVVARYQMANKVHESLGVPVSYVVANPSSYAWPDAMRVLPVDDAVAASAKDGWNQTEPHTKFSYAPFEGAASCAGYNTWPFGLEKRTGGYTAKTSDEQLRKQLVSRPTTFLLGQVDTLPLGGFDSSCGAMAQGPTRRARGEAYVKYISEKFGAKHPIMIVDECGHNNRCVYTTDNVLPVIFPK